MPSRKAPRHQCFFKTQRPSRSAFAFQRPSAISLCSRIFEPRMAPQSLSLMKKCLPPAGNSRAWKECSPRQKVPPPLLPLRNSQPADGFAPTTASSFSTPGPDTNIAKPGKQRSARFLKPISEANPLDKTAVTERLYYHDSFLREFDAQVISCEKDGDRWRVILDRTAFYPTSGGQPHDKGTLREAKVVEVLDDERENVIHFTDPPVSPGPIHGRTDWERRFDHIQQHTGQHLLSAAFIELFKAQTVSFHLGHEISTIDLAAPALDQRQLEAAERRTNEIIFDDR